VPQGVIVGSSERVRGFRGVVGKFFEGWGVENLKSSWMVWHWREFSIREIPSSRHEKGSLIPKIPHTAEVSLPSRVQI
jgi:hypothetical protein